MRHHLILLGLLSMLSLSCGCVGSDYVPVGTATFSPRADSFPIAVYAPLETPVEIQKGAAPMKLVSDLPSDAIVIGRIDGSGAALASWQAVVEDAKRKARTLGGDAIVITDWGGRLAGVSSFGSTTGNTTTTTSVPVYYKVISFNVLRFSPTTTP